MATPKTKPRYNYKALNSLLTEGIDPQSLGNQMDEIMNDLCYAGRDDDYPGDQLECKYYLLRRLRNIFWELGKK